MIANHGKQFHCAKKVMASKFHNIQDQISIMYNEDKSIHVNSEMVYSRKF